jgi:hypothetical protein
VKQQQASIQCKLGPSRFRGLAGQVLQQLGQAPKEPLAGGNNKAAVVCSTRSDGTSASIRCIYKATCSNVSRLPITACLQPDAQLAGPAGSASAPRARSHAHPVWALGIIDQHNTVRLETVSSAIVLGTNHRVLGAPHEPRMCATCAHTVLAAKHVT